MPEVYVGPEPGRDAWQAERQSQADRDAHQEFLHRLAADAAAINNNLAAQLPPIVAYCQAVAGDGTPADEVPLPNLVGAVRLLAAAIQTLAEHSGESCSQRTGLCELIAGPQTGGPGPINEGE